MRLATSAAAALAVVALVATATALGCTAARAAPAPASVPAVGSGGDPFYNERWGKFYTDVQHMLGLPTEYRIMSPWGGPGFSPAWENVPDSQLDMMIRWEDGVYVGIMAQVSVCGCVVEADERHAGMIPPLRPLAATRVLTPRRSRARTTSCMP